MALDKSPASPDSCYDSGIDMLEFPTQKLSTKQLPIPQKPCTSEGQAPLSGCQGEVDSPLISPLSDTGIINLECPFDESRDLPSPPKRRRLKESGRVNKCLEHFGTCSRKLSFGDDGRTHEGEKQSHIKSGKEVERKDPRADYLKYSEGRDARLKRKIEQREMGKLSVALSNDHAGDIGSGTKHVDEMLDLAIRSIDLDRKISMVQRRKKSIEMSLMSLESFDVKEGAQSIKAAQEALKVSETSGNYVESENFKRHLQSAKELKEEAEMSLKFLEKLSGEVEGACHDNFSEGGPSAVDTSSISASWDSESNVDLEKEPELMPLEKKREAVGDKCIEASPTLTGETLPPRDKMATHVAASSSHGNDAKKKSKHVSFKDSEDEIFDLPSSKLNHVSKDIPELQKTAEEENPTQSMSEASKLCRSIKKHLVVATGQNLMRDFIEIFHLDNESSEDGETCDDCIDEDLVKETAEIVRRAMIHLDTEAFNDALQQASEAALGLTSENTKVEDILSHYSPYTNHKSH
ncbi:hypothetical protein EYC84_002162 [Monilinia fructicola]|uniref:Uncharacterized protein n=1 Tax=Monilinia fructicola TaxID=38448 RepID=A0A5M9JP91_MONFR|nr:hypothetical protein EYC84_002162 [Monilinia fructicola]